MSSSNNCFSDSTSSQHHISNYQRNYEDDFGVKKLDEFSNSASICKDKIKELPEHMKVKCINIKTITQRNKRKPWLEYQKWISNPNNVYVGRENKFIGAEGSKWGNPFTVDEFGREGCIQKYEEMLFKKSKQITCQNSDGDSFAKDILIKDDEIVEEVNPFTTSYENKQEIYECKLVHYLAELRGKTLGCWCKPLKCHSDILANAVMELEMEGAFKHLDVLDVKTEKRDEAIAVASHEIQNLNSFTESSKMAKALSSEIITDYMEVNEYGIALLPLDMLPPWNPWKCCEFHYENAKNNKK